MWAEGDAVGDRRAQQMAEPLPWPALVTPTLFASGVCALRYAGVYTVRERQNRENMMKAQATVTAVLLADQDIDDVREAFA
jgi:hypothetical protein